MSEQPLSSVEEQLRLHGVYVSVTSGTSMRPLFRTHRDTVILGRPTGTLRRHDVALYRIPSGKLVLHRVLVVRPTEYLCRGDNTFRLEHVPHTVVVGVLTAFRRGTNRRHSVNEPLYRCYVWIWRLLYPLRYLIHGGRMAAAALWHRLRRGGSHALPPAASAAGVDAAPGGRRNDDA